MRRLCKPFTGRGSRQRKLGRLDACAIELLEDRRLFSTWTSSANSIGGGGGLAIQLSNGTVMVHNTSSAWHLLTPDSTGGYINGTWSSLASMNTARLYCGTAVLPDGRVFVMGGEYSGPGTIPSDSPLAEIYDPVANTWTEVSPDPKGNFGDDTAEVLPNGTVLCSDINDNGTEIYNPATNLWTTGPNKVRNDRSDEESWVKLADGSILTYDLFASISAGTGLAERYIPSTNTWVDASAGTLPMLSTTAVDYELGPGFLLPDGRAFFVGANGLTAFYSPTTNSWSQGPSVPNGLTMGDAPGAILPNGDVLLAVAPGIHFSNGSVVYPTPTSIYEFNPTTGVYTNVTPSSSVINLQQPSYIFTMLTLPTGQVLLTELGSSRSAVYTPTGSPAANLLPTIQSIVHNADSSFTLSGTQLNGSSEGGEYGDDDQMASNYPIVQVTDLATGIVGYARSYNWSLTGVQTGTTPETVQFTMPASLGTDPYSLEVIASGIASTPYFSTTPIFVDPAAPGPTRDGISWQTALPSLQSALSVAMAGTTILVAQGTYYPSAIGDRTETFQLESGVTIMGGYAGSASPMAARNIAMYATILSGFIGASDNTLSNSYHIVTGSGADSTAVLDGFTIVGGNADGSGDSESDNGAGLFDSGGSPTLANCTFNGNKGTGTGGAVFLDANSSPAFSNCTFTGNSAPRGGGMYIQNLSSPTLTNCSFNQDNATVLGGAMYITALSSPALISCTFTGNSSATAGAIYNVATCGLTNCTFTSNAATSTTHGGGALYNANSATAALSGCLFLDNSAGFSGGAMVSTAGATATMIGCTFVGNVARSGNGGAVEYSAASGSLTNCVFTGNSAVGAGGAIDNVDFLGSLTNCTFTANATAGAGGAIENADSSPNLSNCIFWADVETSGGEIDGDLLSIPVVSFSDVQGGYIGAGNLNVDPGFAISPGGIVQLQPNSPCIDAGSNALINATGSTMDIAGHPRIDGANVDLGAFETQIVYVDSQATGLGTGGTWANAYATLVSALAAVKAGQTIDVAAGTYKPTTTASRSATFQLISGVALYGGFAGSSNPNSARNAATYVTTLSGDIGVVGNFSDNSFHVVTGSGVDATALLDGFTITGGNANGPGSSSTGGGIYISGGSPTISNCILTSSNATNGAAAYLSASLSHFSNCTFSNSTASNSGGGAYVTNSTEVFTNCTFSQNKAAFGGGMISNFSTVALNGCVFSANAAKSTFAGGLYNTNEDVALIVGCSFIGNTAVTSGGGMRNDNADYVALTNCVFQNNSAGSGSGGGLDNEVPGTIVTNCTFTGNSATVSGGGIYTTTVSFSVANSILWANTGGQLTGGGGTPTVVNCDVQGGTSGTSVIDVDPQFTNSGAGNLQLLPTSPCIDTGSNLWTQATFVTTDLAGNPRYVDGTVDIGAYEAQLVAISWTGTGGNSAWSNAMNWSHMAVPNQNDQVTIAANFSTIQISGVFSVASIAAASPIEIQAASSLKLFGSAVLSGLKIDSTGTLDIQSNMLTLNFASPAVDPVNTIRGYLQTAYANGAWTGTGLTSSAVETQVATTKGTTGGMWAIGYADGNNDGTLGGAAANQIVLRPALAADFTLDSKIDFNDLLILAQNNGSITADWVHGDGNYDGSVGFQDLLLLAQNVGKTNGNTPLGAQLPAAAILPVSANGTNSKSVFSNQLLSSAPAPNGDEIHVTARTLLKRHGRHILA